MTEVYISGSSGFIGSSFATYLDHIGNSHFKITPGDRQGKCVTKPKIILDFASYGNYSNQKDIGHIYEANLVRLLQLLMTTNHLPYKAFVVTGSSSEYGRCDIPMHEMILPRPDTFYGASKLAAVSLAQVWAKEFNKPVVAVRPFSVTGPGEQQNHLIPTLIKSCMEGLEVNLVPDPVHDFIDIRDFINGVWRVVKRIKDTKGQVINIGSGRQYTNMEVLEIVERETGRKANVSFVDKLRDYDKPLWVADNFRLKSLGWTQQFSLEDSVRDMVRVYGKQR